MVIPDWIIWVWSAGSTLAAGIFALLKYRSEKTTQKIDSISDIQNQNINIWNEVDACKEKLYTTIDLHRQEKERSNQIEKELKKVKSDLLLSQEIISKYIPLAEIEERLRDLHTLEDVLNKIPIPLCVFTSESGGTFTFINKAFANILGVNQNELQDFDWRANIHPDDLNSASLIEASAFERGGQGLRNRYKTKNGKIAHLLWCWSSYRNGVSISVAEVLAITNDRDINYNEELKYESIT